MPTAVRPAGPAEAPAGSAGPAEVRPEGPVAPVRPVRLRPSGPSGCARPEGIRHLPAPTGGGVRGKMRNPPVSPVANKPQIWNPAT